MPKKNKRTALNKEEEVNNRQELGRLLMELLIWKDTLLFKEGSKDKKKIILIGEEPRVQEAIIPFKNHQKL